MIEEQNIIGHLFEVEKQAAELLSEAQKEYNKRIASAREEADKNYKDAYEIIITEAEDRYVSYTKKLNDIKEAAFSDYCKEVQSWKQDIGALHTQLDSILFNKLGKKPI